MIKCALHQVLYNYFMVSVFGWPDPNTGFDQSEHALYTCYFIIYAYQITYFAYILSSQQLWYYFLTYPNPPCQHSPWDETGAPGENQQLSAER
jgi:hypothetical protein